MVYLITEPYCLFYNSIVSSLSNVLSCVTTLAFTDRLHSDSALVCPIIRADLITIGNDLYLTPLLCSCSWKTLFQNFSIHSSLLYAGVSLSTCNNFHSSTILLILSLGCNSDDSFSMEDWVYLLFFFKGLRHPSCLSNSFFKGNFEALQLWYWWTIFLA